MAKCLSCLLSWFLIFLLLQLQIQTGSGSNAIELKVGVPKKDGFTQFVNVVWDSHEMPHVSGYCMDVFDAVLDLLPFEVDPKIEPYVNEFRESAGTYDSLLQQIPSELYDIVVGDITIVANRSKFVDFTLPYTESGVRMLVPAVQRGRHQTMWIFSKPFSWDLWLCIVIISMFIGAVILIMERNVNAQPHQEGSQNRKQLNVIAILWFPLSQAVLPERQVIARNCSRFVLMVWLLLSFVLMQSYTANLTSILTLDQLQPSFLSVDDLIDGGYYVGYQTDSFVHDLLVDRLNFSKTKVKGYSDINQYQHALKIGSKDGGVAAIFDEEPYLKVYLQKFGYDYMMAGPTYRTDGLGFALRLNSTLTAHFSRAILNVTQSEIMDDIEAKYFGKNGLDQSAQVYLTPSLTFHSFAGLFLITGIATILALLVSETVIWRRPILMVKAYSQRYNLFHPTTTSTETRVHPTPSDDLTHQGIEAV